MSARGSRSGARFPPQLVGTGLGTPVAPFTAAKEAALLTVFRVLLPTVYLGLGPRWARLVNVTFDIGADTTNLTILCASELPPIRNSPAVDFSAVRIPQTFLATPPRHPCLQARGLNPAWSFAMQAACCAHRRLRVQV